MSRIDKWVVAFALDVHSLLAHIREGVVWPGLRRSRTTLVDQEASMPDLERSGVGLSLIRESIAITEAQARGQACAHDLPLS